VLDHRIRDFNIPMSSQSPDRPSEMQSFVQEHYIQLSALPRSPLFLIRMFNGRVWFSALMFLHRNYFVKALIENPTNPLESDYSDSFIAAYTSACEILDSTGRNYDKQPLLTQRIWRIWTNAFSAAVGNVA
jgi:hypothetical protein